MSAATEHDSGGNGNPAMRPAGGVALAVTGLSVAYGNVVAVHDATFTVSEGDACATTVSAIPVPHPELVPALLESPP